MRCALGPEFEGRGHGEIGRADGGLVFSENAAAARGRPCAARAGGGGSARASALFHALRRAFEVELGEHRCADGDVGARVERRAEALSERNHPARRHLEEAEERPSALLENVARAHTASAALLGVGGGSTCVQSTELSSTK